MKDITATEIEERNRKPIKIDTSESDKLLEIGLDKLIKFTKKVIEDENLQ